MLTIVKEGSYCNKIGGVLVIPEGYTRLRSSIGADLVTWGAQYSWESPTVYKGHLNGECNIVYIKVRKNKTCK